MTKRKKYPNEHALWADIETALVDCRHVMRESLIPFPANIDAARDSAKKLRALVGTVKRHARQDRMKECALARREGFEMGRKHK